MDPNGSFGSSQTAYLYNFGTSSLIWDRITINDHAFTFGGTGLIIIDASIRHGLYLGSTTRITYQQNSDAHVFNLLDGAILEIGASLSTSGNGDFVRPIGPVTAGLVFQGGGGFSAHDDRRTVNLCGDQRTLHWGENNFVVSGMPLIFSSPYADATLEFQNPLNLGNFTREIRVHNGSADIDAELTGSITGYVISGLNKTGDGTLQLSGSQNYRGDLSIIGGGITLGNSAIFSGNNNLVMRDATLDIKATDNAFNTLELLTDSMIDIGNATGSLTFADSSDKPWTGTLTLIGKPAAPTLRFGTNSNGLTPAQLASITIQGSNEKVALDPNGYLHAIPAGTMIIVR